MTRGTRPAKAKAKAKLPAARNSGKSGTAQRRQLEELLAEAHAQQAATSEVLHVIASSPNDIQPVFDVIAERAMRLCGALHGGVCTFDGQLVHSVAHVDVSPEFSDALRRAFPRPPSRGTATARAILTRSTVHIAD